MSLGYSTAAVGRPESVVDVLLLPQVVCIEGLQSLVEFAGLLARRLAVVQHHRVGAGQLRFHLLQLRLVARQLGLLAQVLGAALEGQARLAFERGAQYLRKQPELARYQAELQQMEAQLARANAMVLNNSQPASEEPSELNEGLKALDADDLWKKKNVYD